MRVAARGLLRVRRPGHHGWPAHHSRARHAEPELALHRGARERGECCKGWGNEVRLGNGMEC
jgi:hypothetical protein